MAPRLGDDAVAGVDEDDGQVRGRCAGDHVARVLHMAGRVGNDEGAAGRGEVAVGDVDGDALLALGAQAVGEEGEVGRVEAAALRQARSRGNLVFVEGLAVIEQPPDECALAVVDAACGGNPQQRGCGGRCGGIRIHRSLQSHVSVGWWAGGLVGLVDWWTGGLVDWWTGNNYARALFPVHQSTSPPVRSTPGACGLPWPSRRAGRRRGRNAR